MPNVSAVLRARAGRLAVELRQRSRDWRPDEDPAGTRKINHHLASEIGSVRKSFADSGRTDKQLDAFAIEKASTEEIRELANLIDEMLERPAVEEPAPSTKKFKFLPSPGRLFLGMIISFIFLGGLIPTVYRSALKKYDGWRGTDTPTANAAVYGFENWNGDVPPKPSKYITDNAGVIPAADLNRINETLAAFERETSDQIIVFVAPSMPDGETIEQVANQAFHAWQIGQKGKDNGVAFFVFTNDRQMRIEVGYGLEGVLPDATCKRILEEVVKPEFKQARFADGVDLGVRSIIATIRNEGYTGSGHTVAELAGRAASGAGRHGFALFMLFLVYAIFGWIASWLMQFGRNDVFSRRYRGSSGGWSNDSGSSSWSSSSSSSDWSSSSDSSSSSSDFSGGGGDSGGGGASSSW